MASWDRLKWVLADRGLVLESGALLCVPSRRSSARVVVCTMAEVGRDQSIAVAEVLKYMAVDIVWSFRGKERERDPASRWCTMTKSDGFNGRCGELANRMVVPSTK